MEMPLDIQLISSFKSATLKMDSSDWTNWPRRWSCNILWTVIWRGVSQIKHMGNIYLYFFPPKVWGCLAKIYVTAQVRNTWGVPGEGKINPEAELLHTFVNHRVIPQKWQCGMQSQRRTFYSPSKKGKQLQNWVSSGINYGLHRISVFTVLGPGASSCQSPQGPHPVCKAWLNEGLQHQQPMQAEVLQRQRAVSVIYKCGDKIHIPYSSGCWIRLQTSA